MRPLKALEKLNISYSVIPCDECGRINTDCIAALIKSNTKAVLTTAASNVAGNILPLRQIGSIARENHLLYFVDGAQLAGFLPLNMEVLGIE